MTIACPKWDDDEEKEWFPVAAYSSGASERVIHVAKDGEKERGSGILCTCIEYSTFASMCSVSHVPTRGIGMVPQSPSIPPVPDASERVIHVSNDGEQER